MGTKKKSIETENVKIPKVGGQQVRSDRNANISDLAGLSVRFKDSESIQIVKNISESGFAAYFDGKLQKGESAAVEITTKNGQHIYDGKVNVAWVDGDLAGFAFTERFLSESFLVHLEICHVISLEVQQALTVTQEIPFEFRDLIFQLRRYLVSLKSRLDQQDTQMNRLGEESRMAFEEALKIVFEKSFIPKMQEFSAQLDRELSKVSDPQYRKTISTVFREELGELLTVGSFMNRAWHKPLGYAGDYEMMNQIYRESLEGLSSFAKLIHLYGITEKSSQSVLERRKLVSARIKKLISEKPNSKICALASGPSKEILDVISDMSKEELSGCTFYLLDQDIEALLNAKRNITTKLLNENKDVDVRFLQISVKDILEGSTSIHELRSAELDLVYTMGLYDYLTQQVATFLTNELVTWVKKDGHIVIGNFSHDNPTKGMSELSLDWRLIHRGDEEMLDLVPQHLVSSSKLDYDSQKIEIFLEITK